ncbi:hypothetical protein Anapl_17071 [Anas platyrhynchos]|uniref:Uncharacterized protein n=1 Tax=Anas platyrhynchos TaxID=8839 RepID=R0KYY7_ANAPL|nr:hypothetical protein Anapl_17071 [Anas platyrhynchos]
MDSAGEENFHPVMQESKGLQQEPAPFSTEREESFSILYIRKKDCGIMTAYSLLPLIEGTAKQLLPVFCFQNFQIHCATNMAVNTGPGELGYSKIKALALFACYGANPFRNKQNAISADWLICKCMLSAHRVGLFSRNVQVRELEEDGTKYEEYSGNSWSDEQQRDPGRAM